MRSVVATPGLLRLVGVSLLARLPFASLSVGLLVHVERLTGSVAAAGLVAGTLTVCAGLGSPLLGRLVDARGQTAVLVASAVAATAALVALAAAPAGAPLVLLAALAAVVGLATPPVGACTRTLLTTLLTAAQARSSYALEAAAVELTWIAGPPLVLAAGAVWSTGAALAAAAAVLAVGTLAFAAHPASRAWRPGTRPARRRGGALATPAMRTLVGVLLLAGALFGAVEVATVTTAGEHGGTAVAGPLLGLWGLGSFAGGLVAARAGGGARTGRGLVLLLAALAGAHLALAALADSTVALAVGLLLAGTLIAPTFATMFALVEHAAPAGTVTEAFAWLSTAVATGAAAGTIGGGAVADAAGPATAFALAGASGAAAAFVAALRTRGLAAATAAAVAPSTAAAPA